MMLNARALTCGLLLLAASPAWTQTSDHPEPTGGAVVESVTPGSPGEAAGLRPGGGLRALRRLAVPAMPFQIWNGLSSRQSRSGTLERRSSDESFILNSLWIFSSRPRNCSPLPSLPLRRSIRPQGNTIRKECAMRSTNEQKGRILHQALATARWLHFARHGLLAERFPPNSALALSTPKPLEEVTTACFRPGDPCPQPSSSSATGGDG